MPRWPRNARKRHGRPEKVAHLSQFGHEVIDFSGKIKGTFTEYSDLTAKMQSQSDGTSEGQGDGAVRFLSKLSNAAAAIREFVAPTYRPERHYMRGPGPAHARRRQQMA